MQNPLPFYPDYNSYPIGDDFLRNDLNLSIETDLFSSSTDMNVAHIPVPSQPNSSSTSISNKKRKATIDTDVSYSPASIYSDNSNYSDTFYPTYSHRSVDQSQGLPSSTRNSTVASTGIGGVTTTSNLTTSAEEGSSEDNDDDEEETTAARKREKHTRVEAQRRALEKAHFRELSLLITNRSDSKSTKLHHLDLLKIAADQITEMNARHQHDPLRPSNLTDNELNFLTIEASNSFLFVTTMEPLAFRVIHVTDSVNRILNFTVDQWCGQNFFSFVHTDDQLRVQNQLMSLNPSSGMKIHLECRLKYGHIADRYSSVIIDGMPKKIDQSLRPVQNNAHGYLAFVGVCHIPLTTKYSETNMSIHKNPEELTFRCRCSPNDWKIFLVDRSISTLSSVSYDLFRQKSILDFIHANDQAHIHQVLLHSTTTTFNDTIQCHFIHPTVQTIIPMTVEIKSFFNPVLHRADFIELTFKSRARLTEDKIQTSIWEFLNDTNEIDKLLEPDLPSTSNQQAIEQPLHGNRVNSTTQNVPYYYSDQWPTKSEILD